jgi:hypothetical protein
MTRATAAPEEIAARNHPEPAPAAPQGRSPTWPRPKANGSVVETYARPSGILSGRRASAELRDLHGRFRRGSRRPCTVLYSWG